MTLYTFLNYLKNYIPIEVIYKKKINTIFGKRGKQKQLRTTAEEKNWNNGK